MESRIAHIIDEQFPNNFIVDGVGKYKPCVCVVCDEFLSMQNHACILIGQLIDKKYYILLHQWNRVSEELWKQYSMEDFPHEIDEEAQEELQAMVLSPRASYLTFTDKRKTEGYSICHSCKYHLSRDEVPPFAIANNNVVVVAPECLTTLREVELAFITPVHSYGCVFTFTGSKQRQLKGVLSY